MQLLKRLEEIGAWTKELLCEQQPQIGLDFGCAQDQTVNELGFEICL